MKNNLILVVAIAGLLIAGQPKLRTELAKLVPAMQPAAPDLAAPDATLQSAVAPVTTALAGHAGEAAVLSAFFAAFADVQQKFPDRFDSIAKLENHIQASTKLLKAFESWPDEPGKTVNPAFAGALTTMLGSDEAKPLDAQRVHQALMALAWACGQR